jgi:hypothetical protein
MFINLPAFSISYFGILLVLLGYFKWKIYGFIMTFIWIGVTIQIIYDIYRLFAKLFIYLMNLSKSQHKDDEDTEDDVDDKKSVVSDKENKRK